MKYKKITIIATVLFLLGSCSNNDDNGVQEINSGSIILSDAAIFQELSSDELDIQFQKDLNLFKLEEEKKKNILENRMLEDYRLIKEKEENTIDTLSKKYEEEMLTKKKEQELLDKLIEEEINLAKIREQEVLDELDKKYKEEQKSLEESKKPIS